eukprot:1870178-Rhodomonas_salina.1
MSFSIVDEILQRNRGTGQRRRSSVSIEGQLKPVSPSSGWAIGASHAGHHNREHHAHRQAGASAHDERVIAGHSVTAADDTGGANQNRTSTTGSESWMFPAASRGAASEFGAISITVRLSSPLGAEDSIPEDSEVGPSTNLVDADHVQDDDQVRQRA